MFLFWYKEETLETQITEESQVTTASNHMLYAKWIDSQPPEKPSTPDLIAGHDTGSSDTDNITQWWWNITIQGTAEANSTITIYKNETQYGQIQANASGNWSASVNNNQNEWTNWKVTATDAAGNVSEMSDALAIYSDTTIPTVPTVTYNSGANTCTWKNNYNITVSSTDTGAGVWKYEYDRDGDGVADFEWLANWILEDRDGDGIDDYLVQDTNFVPNDGYQSCSTRFRAVDCTGNVSDWTEVHHIHMDTSAPTPTTWYFGTVSNTLVELYIQVTDNIGISSVQVPTSTESGGYNDWIWYNATLVDASQNLYKAYIYPSNFGKYGTNYKSHLYIYDHAGNGGFYWESSPVWVPALNYTVTLDSQSATYAGTTSVTATYGSAMPSITVPTKNGYVFGGYYTSTGGSGTQYYNANGTSARNYDMTSNTTLYAKWEANTYTVTLLNNEIYNLDNVSSASGERMNYSVNNGVVTVTATNDDGYGYINARVNLEAGIDYNFRCDHTGTWGYTPSDNTVEAFLMLNGETNTIYHMISDNFTFTPTVTGTYWLRLDVNQNGATHLFSNISVSKVSTARTITATYDSAMPTITVPTMYGYIFEGYYSSTNVYGTQYYKADGTSARNWDKTVATTLYANWKINLLYNLNNVSTTNSFYMNYSVNNGTVTVTALQDDGYGYTNGRVNLEAGVTYNFSCDHTGTWLSESEAFLMLNGNTTTNCHMASDNYTFTPPKTGTYWLRLDVNQNGTTQRFWNIVISRV